MKQKLLFPFLLGAVGFFLTTPYNMSHSIFISAVAVMGHYFVYGIALQQKWQYSPLQVLIFWLAQPIVSVITIPLESSFAQVQEDMPYLFPIVVPVFTFVAGISLALGYLWSLQKMKKMVLLTLTLLWVGTALILWKDILPTLSFQQNSYIFAKKMPTSPLNGLNTSDLHAEMCQGKKTYFFCCEPLWTDKRLLKQLQRLYDMHKNNQNVQIGLVVCHSDEKVEIAQIKTTLAGYTFPQYEDNAREWSKYVAQYRGNVGFLIDEKGNITHRFRQDYGNTLTVWEAEMGDFLVEK